MALPLYPQFSTTTTLSSFVTFKRAYKGKAPVKYLCDYPQNPAFAKACRSDSSEAQWPGESEGLSLAVLCARAS